MYQFFSELDNIFLPDSSEYLCPTCKKGDLIYRDHCKRIVRHECGEFEWIRIPRCQCSNPGCRKVHRMIPDFLVPYKHYEEPIICDAVDERIDPAESDDRPSSQSIRHWKYWVLLNADDINGHLKSVAHRELGYGEELLKSGVSLLAKLRESISDGWLKIILRTIYNSGAFLQPVYN